MIEILEGKSPSYPFMLYTFQTNSKLENAHSSSTVCNCGYYVLSISYLKIIKELKEAGLLPEHYQPMCCKCHSVGKKERKESKKWKKIERG